MHKRLTKLYVWGIYALVALLILTPWLGRGYILTLDMVFTPHIRIPASVTSSYLWNLLLHILNFVLPSDIIQKIMLFVILLLAGVGMHRLLRYITSQKSDIYQTLSLYFAGIFYMINPFTYDRLMAGQYNVLFGYALLPWFARALLVFLDKPSVRKSAIVAAWVTIIGIVSIHTVGMTVLLALIGTCFALWQHRKQSDYLQKLLKLSLLAIAIFIVASSYWLVPLALGRGSTASAIAGFGAGDQQAFATVGSNTVAKLGNVLRLQGFWTEDRGMYTLPQEHIPTWGLIALLLWLLIIVGGVSLWKAGKRRLVIVFGSSALIAAVLAGGTLTGWLAGHIPLFAGYREPEKFVAIVALSFAILAASGVATTLKFCKEQGGKIFFIPASIVILAIPFVFASIMLWGCNHQLSPTHYPAEWFAINRQLEADRGNFQTLFLPWHLYMSFNFTNRVIANPAPGFFGKPIIISDNPEFKTASLAGTTPAKRTLDRLLQNADRDPEFAYQLAALNIKYIVLANDDDFDKYAYLSKLSHIQLISSSATIELYRNEAYQ